MQSWYAVQTKPRREQRAALHLHQRNLQVYLPLLRVKPVNPRASRERPYFPGYLFVRLDMAVTGLALLQWTPGIRGLVQFGGQPATVPDHFIHELKQRLASILASGGLAAQGFRQGDPVKITHGPFAGYEAVFDLRLRDTERVRVLLEMLHRSIPVELNADWIGRARPAR